MQDTFGQVMDYSVNNNFRNIIKSSVGRQSFFSLPTPLVVITCSYINYIAITYYLELSENPIVTIIYLSTAYSWAFASILLSGRVGFKINSLDIWVGILFIIIAEGYVASLGLNKEFIFMVFNLVINYLLARHLRFKELPRFYWFLFIALTQILAYGLLNLPLIFQDWQSSTLKPTLFGTGASLSTLGTEMGFFLTLTITLLPLIKNTNVKFVSVLLAILAAIILLLSSARTAIIACGLALLIYLIINKLISKRRKFYIVIFALATLFIFLFIAPQNLKDFNRFENTTDLINNLTTPLNSQDNLDVDSNFIDSENNTLGIRVLIIRSCLVKFSDNILLGYGPGRLFIPHNAFLQIVFEHGLFAGAICVLICLKIIYELLRIMKFTCDISRHYAMILMSIFIYNLIYLQVLGTTLTMDRFFILIGISVSFINHFNTSNNRVRKPLESIQI